MDSLGECSHNCRYSTRSVFLRNFPHMSLVNVVNVEFESEILDEYFTNCYTARNFKKSEDSIIFLDLYVLIFYKSSSRPP